jgi:hypothetical protein
VRLLSPVIEERRREEREWGCELEELHTAVIIDP